MSATSETLLKQIFYQMFLSQQVKRNVIITNKNGKYELTYELPNEARLRTSQTSLSILPRNYEKLSIELPPQDSTLHEILSFSQVFCQWLVLPDLKLCDSLPFTWSKKMHILHHL